MVEVLEKEYKRFLKDIRNGRMPENYLDEAELEDEFSHNEINNAQEVFLDLVKKFLHANYPDTYIAYKDWCVHIMSIDDAEKRHVRILRSYLA